MPAVAGAATTETLRWTTLITITLCSVTGPVLVAPLYVNGLHRGNEFGRRGALTGAAVLPRAARCLWGHLTAHIAVQ